MYRNSASDYSSYAGAATIPNSVNMYILCPSSVIPGSSVIISHPTVPAPA